MSPLAASVVLLWAVVILLCFAFFGLLREFRMTQRRTGAGVTPAVEWPERWAAPESDAALMLIIDGSCRLCAEAVETFASEVQRSPGVPASILADIQDTADRYADLNLPVAVDRETYGRVYPGWAPALAVFRRGELQDVKPAGSSKAIEAIVAATAAQTREGSK